MIRLVAFASVLLSSACDTPPLDREPPTADIVGCDGQVYPNRETADYVLPFPVGDGYRMNLGNCSRSYHGPGQADRYAYDFNTQIGDTITASRAGVVVHVEESGRDGGFPNNLVVVDHGDGTFGQYMHLTHDGADVEVGNRIEPGDAIGRSGNTGLAGYPHLHFVVTRDGWEWPYDSTPVAFRNARPAHTVLEAGITYRATDD